MEGEGRLVWRCRRGMRELDALLTRYLKTRYLLAGAVERQAFESTLELTDPELWAFVLGQAVPSDPAMRHVIEQIADPRA
ncbi:MAG TPA: succinate dehydrogenase assembly factor 2 [Steroidobacteraceae bacterium]|nr:succinate dehydrogenase assembly factor 2 [Steroidobacteraceae bacterium]